MDRGAWLAEQRAAGVTTYDSEAPTYDQHEYPVPLHASFVDRLLATCPAGGLVLDAPCGTGRYFAQVVASGRRVVGIDQSPGMLAQARERGLTEELHLVGLQELDFGARFDAVMTVDAMEHVPPEDWPLVVANLARALRPGGHQYLTLEETDDAAVEAAFDRLIRAGVPAVRGEVIEGDVAAYHYYPGREQALEWLETAGFEPVEEAVDQQADWGYRHLLLRQAGHSQGAVS
jgi:SAM-dependent methyltransferase